MAYHSNKLKSFFGAAIALGTMTAANDAFSQSVPQTLSNMVTGQCYDAQLVRNTLDSQNQYALISGYSTTDTRPKNIFTSNSNGSLGYHVVRGEGDVNGKLCIRAKYTDVKINTSLNLSEPSWARVGNNTEHNRWLNERENTRNAKVLLGATAIVPDAAGHEVRGAFIMVTKTDAIENTNVMNGGAVTATQPNGSTTVYSVMVNVEKIEPTYANFAKQNVQVASLNR